MFISNAAGSLVSHELFSHAAADYIFWKMSLGIADNPNDVLIAPSLLPHVYVFRAVAAPTQ